MKKIYLYISILSLIILSFSLIVGCISDLDRNDRNSSNPFWTKISSIYIKVSINATEIKCLNFSDIKPKIESLNYSIRNDSTIDKTDYVIYSKEFILSFIHRHNESTGYLLVEDQSTFYGNSEDEVKQNEKAKIEKIADICDITIDWCKAEWTINYFDGSP